MATATLQEISGSLLSLIPDNDTISDCNENDQLDLFASAYDSLMAKFTVLCIIHKNDKEIREYLKSLHFFFSSLPQKPSDFPAELGGWERASKVTVVKYARCILQNLVKI